MNRPIGIRETLARRWRVEGGYREVLVMALPLVASTASWSLQQFVDRMFLAWYSRESLAAAMPAGILNLTMISLFIGLASYVSTFAAQYYGARRFDRLGPVVWQGIYVAIFAGIVILPCIPAARSIFALAGHEAAVQELEVRYFRILCLGAFPVVASSAMAAYFSGLGMTGVVMWVNLAATAENIIMDYCLIFGRGGFPAMGIEGAAIATVLSPVIAVVIYSLIMFSPAHERRCGTRRGWRFDPALFGRLCRFGLPGGVQFFVDIAGFSLFLLFVGRLGTLELAATSVAFNVNSVAFMPIIGMGIAVSVIVGQYLGGYRPDLAERGVWSCFHLAALYMGLLSLLYAAVPGLFLAPFIAGSVAGDFSAVADMAAVLLRFVAFYSIFDAMAIIFSSAIKGAGDTRFVMGIIAAMSLLVLVIPGYLLMLVFRWGLYAGWICASVYAAGLGLIFLRRFKGGLWRTMRVIEDLPHHGEGGSS